MKFALVLLFAAVAFASDKYTDKYDDLDFETILSNKRLVEGYGNCLLDKGNCAPEGRELKSHVGEALETGCAMCTDKQQEATKIILPHLINKTPELWSKLVAKYDPNGKYARKYEKEYREIQA